MILIPVYIALLFLFLSVHLLLFPYVIYLFSLHFLISLYVYSIPLPVVVPIHSYRVKYVR
jgi:hypothetical protein